MNIFSKTEWNKKEEDRQTNGLLILLEYGTSTFRSEFLKFLFHTDLRLSADDWKIGEHEVVTRKDVPDAIIRCGSQFAIILEVKLVGEDLFTKDQPKRYLDLLRNKATFPQDFKFLALLSPDTVEPIEVDPLRLSNSDETCSVHWRSWQDLLKWLREYEKIAAVGVETFLVNQYLTYLEDRGMAANSLDWSILKQSISHTDQIIEIACFFHDCVKKIRDSAILQLGGEERKPLNDQEKKGLIFKYDPNVMGTWGLDSFRYFLPATAAKTAWGYLIQASMKKQGFLIGVSCSKGVVPPSRLAPEISNIQNVKAYIEIDWDEFELINVEGPLAIAKNGKITGFGYFVPFDGLAVYMKDKTKLIAEITTTLVKFNSSYNKYLR